MLDWARLESSKAYESVKAVEVEEDVAVQTADADNADNADADNADAHDAYNADKLFSSSISLSVFGCLLFRICSIMIATSI